MVKKTRTVCTWIVLLTIRGTTIIVRGLIILFANALSFNVTVNIILVMVSLISFNYIKDFSLTVKAATLIFIFVRGSAILSAKEGKSGFIYNLVKSKLAF